MALAYAGEYKIGLPSDSNPDREITLELLKDGTIEWTTDNVSEGSLIVEVGMWTANSDGTITVSVTGKKDETPYADPVVTRFKLVGQELTAVEYDQTEWGTLGLTLKKQ